MAAILKLLKKLLPARDAVVPDDDLTVDQLIRKLDDASVAEAAAMAKRQAAALAAHHRAIERDACEARRDRIARALHAHVAEGA